LRDRRKCRYNVSYLAELQKIVGWAAAEGIYTVLDWHQDLLSERFCGEGIPNWALNKLCAVRVAPFRANLSRKASLRPFAFACRTSLARTSLSRRIVAHSRSTTRLATLRSSNALLPSSQVRGSGSAPQIPRPSHARAVTACTCSAGPCGPTPHSSAAFD
jgi:hypothetical protein